jgi:hypothetical protein
MTEYINVGFYKSAQPLTAEDQNSFNSLFDNDKGTERVTVSREGISIEYNIYIYSKQQITELLINNGFIILKEKKLGFIRRQIQLLAKSNYKYYGSRKPDCC